MRKSLLLTALSLLLLQGCGTVQRVMVQGICPSIPPLEQDSALLEPTFQDRMESFLQGNLPAQTSYELTSSNAKLPTAKPAQR